MFENKKELADEPENTQMTPLSEAEDNAFAGLQSKVLDPSPISSAGDDPENSHNKGGATATDPTEGEPEQDIDAQIFGSNAYLQSADVQYLQDMIEAAAILAAGDNLEDMDESDLAKIANPSLRARLKAAIDVKRSEESTAESLSTVEAQRQEWDSQDHEFGGKTWSPEDLRAFLKWADDPKNLDAVDQEMLAQGYSKEEIKTMRQKFLDAKKLQEKEANGETLSKEEQAKLDAYKKDPDFVRYTEEADRQHQSYGQRLQLAIASETNAKNSVSSATVRSVDSRADVFSDLQEEKPKHKPNDPLLDNGISSNVILLNEFENAKKATTPLDAEKRTPKIEASVNINAKLKASGVDFG